MKNSLFVLALLLLFVLCACGKTEAPETTEAPNTETPVMTEAPAKTDPIPETIAPETTVPEVSATTETPVSTEAPVSAEAPKRTEAPVTTPAPVGDKTVAYLKTGGKGDGSSAENACGSLADALNTLDLSKDCTVVVCGKYALDEAFVYDKTFTGKVTLTSVYGGKDYRGEQAAVSSIGVRFVCSGEYIFKDLDFRLLGTYFFIIGNYHPVTVDTGVTVTSINFDFNGQKFGNAFSILGGSQAGQPEILDGDLPDGQSGKDTYITVKSGNNINIGAFGRQIQEEKDTGTAHITVGDNAVVTKLYLTPCNKPFTSGVTEVTVADNATVEEMYAVTATGTAKAFTVNWLGGKIGSYKVALSESNELTLTDGATLNYAKAVASDSAFADVSILFDNVNEK